MQTFLEFLKALFYGIIEGITEWLPISSTGHLLLFEEFFPFNVSDEFMNMFRVVIQLGAIMAVVILYFKRLNPFDSHKSAEQKKDTWQLWLKMVVASVPLGVIGLTLDDWIDAHLHGTLVIALMLILYGVGFIIIENKNAENKLKISTKSQHSMTYKTALLIGCAQALAVIPGTSRSGATILGAMLLGCARPVAAEFSFFLAIPAMVGASGLKTVKLAKGLAEAGTSLTGTEIGVLIIGVIVSFITSVFAIKFLMGFIKKHDFKPFGWYRIALGGILILYFLISLGIG